MRKRKNGEGSYGTKTIKGVKYQYFRDSDGKYTYGRTPKELNDKLKAQKEANKLEELSNVKANNTYIFSDYCYEWLKTKRHDITSGSYDDYEIIIDNRIENFDGYDIGNKQIKSLTAEMFNSYFNALSKKYSKGSIDKTWTVIKQVLEYGMDEGDIPKFDLKKIKRPKEEDVAVKKKDIPFITLEDMELLYEESNRLTGRNTPFYGNGAKVIIFIMYSGLRISEAIGLKWKYVSQDLTSIRIEQSSRTIVKRDENGNALTSSDGKKQYQQIQKSTKTKNGVRTIPLPDRAIEILKYFNEIPHTSNDNVFLTANKTIFGKRNLERILSNMLEHSNCYCKNYTPHSLRHGYGSVLISKGVDIKIVSELLGHSDVAFTYNVYIGILKEDKINAVKNVFNQCNEEKKNETNDN